MLTTFTGRVGDRNDQAMRGAGLLGDRVAERWACEQRRVGTPDVALNGDWRTELVAAREPLGELAAAVRAVGETHRRPLTVMPRCAGALATLPVVLERHPGACVVWFDAHADLHLPATTTSGYLGGMALSGALGWWDSGAGAGAADVVLAGTRDIDPAEHRLIERHGIRVVTPGPGFAERLAEAVGQGPVYVHLDCDVLEPGIVPTDYRVPHGLGLAELHAGLQGLSGLDVVGFEIAELQDNPDGTPPDLDPLLTALAPLLDLAAAG